ncbi:MAG: ATP-dependent zinc metalloprotease FtsH [Spirochaetales bacterium]|nr:ATP-dependent zinc metalloprotease FtsH [Spirochaetales bacterium]
MDNNDQEPNRKVNFRFDNNRFALIFLIALVGIFFFIFLADGTTPAVELPYSTFYQYLQDGQIDTVKILDYKEIHGVLKSQGVSSDINAFRTRIPYPDDDLMPLMREKGVRVKGDSKGVSPLLIILQTVPWLLGLVFIWFMFRQVQGSGNRAFSFGKSRAKRYTDNGKNLTFGDVAGQKEAKYELQEVVDFLKNPQKFTKIGAKIPKGVLLVGMPGTGKTLLAKACAGEANVSFFHMSGSDFVEMFVGVGASRVRDLFEQGRKNAPCILFIDELDAVGRTRGAGMGGGHDEREQTLNQMLVEMDGFETKDGVIILAATNRPDVLDPALLRPGRFDRQVVVDMPDVQEREDILKIHGKKVPLGPDVDLNRIARATPGTSGADLANLVNEAALFAARDNREQVIMKDFEDARDKLLLGVARRSRVISPEEKKMTAYHEAGHALLHYLLPDADPLHKVTVIPHGRALGLAMSLPEKEIYSRNKKWLLARIKIAMGGFAAEKLTYGETTTGTKSDIEQATALARKMVVEWGMSDELGFITFGQEDEPIFLGKEIARHKDYSETTATTIDKEIQSILRSCQEDTEALLKEHKDSLVLLAENLYEKESLGDREIRELLGYPEVKKVTDL